MTDKEKYRKLCVTETTIPIFSKDWWLDAVCGKDNWDVALVENKGGIIAAIPYFAVKDKCGFKKIVMPKLTQTMGPWLRSSNAKYANQLAEQKDFMGELISKLPAFNYFSQNFHYSITNWLPFYWQGFAQTTRYTYVLEDLTNIEQIWDGMLPNIRKEIKKAKNRFKLDVLTDLPVETFLDINEMSFIRQEMKLPYSRNLVQKLDHACEAHNARKIFYARDEDGRIHAALFIIWDENSAYYLMGGSDPDLRTSGANSLCMWEAIRFSATVTKRFDFEGSMIESVERFFRAFGAVQVPYFQITKDNRLLVIKGLIAGRNRITHKLKKLKTIAS